MVYWVIALVLDQLSKAAARSLLATHGCLFFSVAGFSWHWTLVFNPGVAFGLLGHQPWAPACLGAVTGLATLVLAYLAMSRRAQPRAWAWQWLLAGAMGNWLDRVIHGRVTDFIDLSYRSWHWPAFNLADACLCLAVLALSLEATPPAQPSDPVGSDH